MSEPEGTAPFKLGHLDHLVLRTSQLEVLLAFYERLGCRLERDLREKVGMVQLRLGDSMLDLVEATMDETGDKNLDHFAVRVDPFNEADILKFCEEEGIEARSMSFPLYGADGYGPAIYITDPDGNRMELKGPPQSEAGAS